MRWAPKVAWLGIALALTSCTGNEPAETPSPSPSTPVPTRSPQPTTAPAAFDPDAVRIGLQRVASGFEAPLLVADAADGSGRLFVVEQAGRIWIVSNGRTSSRPFLDLTDRVASGGERGLLGLAFHPSYERNGRFFVNYTDNDGDTMIAEYRRSDDSAARADPGSARTLLRIDQPYANHNGGGLVFGPDGFLYVGMGDGGSAGDPHENGQRLDTLLGKMLRIDVDRRSGDKRYAIPRDNPFAGRDGARAEIWAYGLRNPWRFSFDQATGDLWIGDVGQNALEEIDRAPGGKGGLNYGWNHMEGNECYEPRSGCRRTGLVQPIAVYGHGAGCSVTGGFVYRGRRYPALRGGYLFSDHCSGTIWALEAEGPKRQDPVKVRGTSLAVSSFGEDEAGELYVVDHAGGSVYRVTARAR